MEQLVAGHEDSNGCINYEGETLLRPGGPRGGVGPNPEQAPGSGA